MPAERRLLLVWYYFGQSLSGPEWAATYSSVLANAASLSVLLLADSDGWRPAPNFHIVRTTVDEVRSRLANFASERMTVKECSRFGGDICSQRGGCCGCECCGGCRGTEERAVLNASALVPTIRMLNDVKPLLPFLFHDDIVAKLDPRPDDLLGYGA